LQERARERIESCLESGHSCEAISIIESVITDRLESRLNWLNWDNQGFKTLGSLIQQLRPLETDEQIKGMLDDLDHWRVERNGAIHELVKVEDGVPHKDWDSRMNDLSGSANRGYELLKRLYHRVADLNPSHRDRVFPFPRSPDDESQES
jgi:hypothetical protein